MFVLPDEHVRLEDDVVQQLLVQPVRSAVYLDEQGQGSRVLRDNKDQEKKCVGRVVGGVLQRFPTQTRRQYKHLKKEEEANIRRFTSDAKLSVKRQRHFENEIAVSVASRLEGDESFA